MKVNWFFFAIRKVFHNFKMISSKSVCLCLALIVLVFMPASKFSTTEALIDDVVEVLKLGKDITSTVLETWNLVEQTNLGGEVEIPFRKEKQKKILNRINEVSRRINTFEDNVSIRVWSQRTGNRSLKKKIIFFSV